MEFKFYFLKEGTRNYSKTDLITFLSSNTNIISPDAPDEYGNRIYLYHHPVLNFEAKFVMSETAVIQNIHDLDPKYFDVNFYVAFDVLLSNYAVEILLDIMEEISRQFRFCFYNEAMREVQPFRRSMMIKLFDAWKKSYAAKFPEKVAQYNFLDPQAFSQVYGYLQKRKRIELTFDKSKTVVTNYIFLHAEMSRCAYIGIKWDGENEFILPPAVEIMCLDNGKVKRYLPMAEIMSRADKMFKPIDGFGDILILDSKYVKKFYKMLQKDRFAPLHVQLQQISIDRILDV